MSKDWLMGNAQQRVLQAQDAQKDRLMNHEHIGYIGQGRSSGEYTLRAKLNGRLAALEQDTKQAQEDYKKAEKLGILDMNADELHRLFGHFLR